MVELDENQQLDNKELNLIQGELPLWLKGIYIYNGPAKYTLKNQKINHWLDGLAMLYKFHFLDGKIFFSNKFIKSDVYLDSLKEGKLTQSFVEKEILNKDEYSPYLTTNSNIHTALINKKYVALGETTYPVKFDLKTLNTLGPFLLEDDQPFQARKVHELAHMKKDPISGDYYNVKTSFGFFSYYHIYKIKAGTEYRQVFFKKHISYPSYMHDFSITKNYVILIAPPLTVNAWNLRNLTQGYINYFNWEKHKPTKIYVVHKYSGKKIFQGECPALFTFHHINAYEKDELIIVDFIAYPDSSIIYKIENQSLSQSYLYQLIIDIKKHKIYLNKNSLTNILKIDLPRINEMYTGQDYNYFYAVNFTEQKNKRGLVKINLKNNDLKTWELEDYFSAEALFVLSPQAILEDEGILMSIVHNKKNNKSFLLILDAISMKEIAKINIPFLIPLGLHGNFWKANV